MASFTLVCLFACIAALFVAGFLMWWSTVVAVPALYGAFLIEHHNAYRKCVNRLLCGFLVSLGMAIVCLNLALLVKMLRLTDSPLLYVLDVVVVSAICVLLVPWRRAYHWLSGKKRR